MLDALDMRLKEPDGKPSSTALVVDLDGTLLKTDLLLESLLLLLKQAPVCLFYIPFWLLRGKAFLKFQIAQRVSLDASSLPYQEQLLVYLLAQRSQGRTIVLATASTYKSAEQVAGHLKIFDLVLASDEVTNLSGEAKRVRLVKEFGEQGFDYAGNGAQDMAVWGSARKAIIVNPSAMVSLRIPGMPRVDRVLDDRKKGLFNFLHPLRPEHWLKNLLVFVPLAASHQFMDVALLGKAFLAFAVFACLASCGYLINDLLDLAADRRHPRKRSRPFAAGDLPLSYALAMILALLALGVFLATFISPLFTAAATSYFVLTAAYSMYVKNIAILDVLLLAGLYTLRIVAGAAAVAIWPSPWILSMAIFLFFSLALVKRYSELVANHVNARGYELGDLEILASMGVAAGYVATFVLVLFLSTATVHSLNGRSPVLWLLCPLLMYGISHIWLSAHRGKMPDDPIVFITTDWTSRIVLLAMFTTFLFGYWLPL